MTDKFKVRDDIPEELLCMAKERDIRHDKKLDTKPVSYLMDAWYRFSRNKGSIAAAIILLLLGLYAIFVPIFSRYSVSYHDTYYMNALPKCELFASWGFWDGTKVEKDANQADYDRYNAIPGALVEVVDTHEITNLLGVTTVRYDLRIDSYAQVGWKYISLTAEELEAAQQYEEKTGIQLFYPLIDNELVSREPYKENANIWYKHNAKGLAVLDDEGNYQNIYQTDENGDYVYFQSQQGGAQYKTRVLYEEWYTYQNGHAPVFLFGVDGTGKDIFTCLGVGARVSFLIGISVSIINFLIGTVWGAIEGYYGGKVDMYMQRFTEILYQMPFIVVMSLLQIMLRDQLGAIGALLLAYVLTGWIGTSGTVRMQFYRYKGQEYVLAARTLGARDRHLMFKHILPNSLGTIVTSSVLMIPNAIFSESFLSYMGLINLSTSNLTSIGTMLAQGQSCMKEFPHIIFFPALFISLMMISFNIFGNGLRDAFNPSLRGSEG